MIRSFKTRGVAALWEEGGASKVRAELVDRILRRLDVLNAAQRPEDMNVPGFNFRKLRRRPIRHSIHVNGPWCITFEWEDQDAIAVRLEQYH